MIMRKLRITALLGVAVALAFTLAGCRKIPPKDPVVATPNPTVELVAGSPVLLGSTSPDLLAQIGYKQTEFFISGSARSYTSDNATQTDGKWKTQIADSANYKTRIVVFQPVDAAAFNGTVIMEWLNVSGGIDTSTEWIAAHTELVRKGYIWIGVSAQQAGIDGGGVNLTGLQLHLKAFNPERYNTLLHPGDKYSFDMFSQAAQAVLHPQGVDPLGGLRVERLIAAGQSQSADFLVTYVNGIAPTTKLFHGYFIHSRFRGTVGLAPEPLTSAGRDFNARSSVLIRNDLDVPVIVLQTETDMLQMGAYTERQPDTSKFRWWEVAGTAHADLYVSKIGAADLGNNPAIAAVVEIAAPTPPFIVCGKPVNSGPQHFVVKAAVAALDNWLRNGVAPPSAARLEIDGQALTFLKDSVGNVLGGVRTPYVDAPIAVLSGTGQPSNSTLLCSLFGTTQLFDQTQLMSLYPDHATFIAETNDAVDGAVNAGFLLAPDGDLIKAWAQSTTIGNY